MRKLHREGANLLLVGEPGVGKTTVLVEAVRVIERLHAEEAERRGEHQTQTRIFWLTSAGRLIAGMKYLGQWEERLEQRHRRAGPHSRRAVRGPAARPGAHRRPFQPGRVPHAVPAARRAAPGRRGDAGRAGRLPPPAARLRRPVPRAAPAAVRPARGRWPSSTAPPSATPATSASRSAPASAIAFITFSAASPRTSRSPAPRPASCATCASARRRAGRGRAVTPEDVVSQFVRRTGLPRWLLRDEELIDREKLLAALAVAGDRPGGRRAGGGAADPDVQGGAERPEPAGRRAAVLRPDRRRQDGAGPRPGGAVLRPRRGRGRRAGPADAAAARRRPAAAPGHERVRRLRRGGAAARAAARRAEPVHPADAATAVLRGAAGRDREGGPAGVRRAAERPGRGPADGSLRPHDDVPQQP